MKYTITNEVDNTSLVIIEEFQNDKIIFLINHYESGGVLKHYLSLNDLSDFIGVLLHIQSKLKRNGRG